MGWKTDQDQHSNYQYYIDSNQNCQKIHLKHIIVACSKVKRAARFTQITYQKLIQYSVVYDDWWILGEPPRLSQVEIVPCNSIGIWTPDLEYSCSS